MSFYGITLHVDGRRKSKVTTTYLVNVTSNNSTSAYATHILYNRHEYGTKEDTVKLLKKCQKRKHTDCLEALYMRTFHQKKYSLTDNR